MGDTLKADILSLKDEMISLRRDFHMYPELGMQEHRTAGIIENYLRGLGLEVKAGIAETGVVCVIEGNGPGKTLMLRADMDALPLDEKNDIPYCSRNEGLMHACAHDGHMAILLALAKLLNNRRNEFSGKIKLVFQPAEENAAGAFFMINEGVLENPDVKAALGLHLFTSIPIGFVGIREGVAMSCADIFSITINGKSGHISQPEKGIDAIHIAGHVITSLQSLISREISPQAAAVVHIGMINGGTANNIIADRVALSGSVRTFDDKIRTHIEDRMGGIVNNIAAAFRGTSSFNYLRGYPGLKNDKTITQLVKEVAGSVLGPEKIITPEPIMGSEDMSFFLEKVPGCFFFVGAGNKEKGLNHPHHNEFFNFDEDALVIGAEIMARAAFSYLNRLDS
jgi:amidohydrolase